jgi:hypothetical protein
MAICNCLLRRETCNCEHSADLIDRLNNVKSDVNDYFVIVDAVNAITALRTKLKELSEDICLQRDDAWDEGFACGREQGQRLDDRGSNLDGN